jgi:1-deoxy-D-xylulose-5-phosphate reductoisomerase
MEALKAQMGMPDMKLPIQYALAFPQRVHNNFPRFDFKRMNTLTFEEPDIRHSAILHYQSMH